jgi:hypothetical protein
VKKDIDKKANISMEKNQDKGEMREKRRDGDIWGNVEGVVYLRRGIIKKSIPCRLAKENKTLSRNC